MNEKFPVGKDGLLNVIKDVLGENKTGRFLELNGTDLAFNSKSQAFMEVKFSEKYLLRSASTVECRTVGASFAGLNESDFVNWQNIEEVRNQVSLPFGLVVGDKKAWNVFFSKLKKSLPNSGDLVNDIINTKQSIKVLSDEYDKLLEGVERGDYANYPEGYLELEDKIDDLWGYGLNYDRKELKKLLEKKKEFRILKEEIQRFVDKNVGISEVRHRCKERGFLGYGSPLEKILEKAEVIENYAQNRGVSLEGAQMNFILHEYFDGERVILMRHPNNPNEIHIEHYNLEKNGYTSKMEETSSPITYDCGISDRGNRFFYLTQDYLKVLNEGNLDENITYLMEARVNSKGEHRCVQLTPSFSFSNNSEMEYWHFGEMPSDGYEYDIQRVRRDLIEYVEKESGQKMVVVDFNRLSKNGLPLDIILEKNIHSLFICGEMAMNHYLDHVGLRNLERVKYVNLAHNNLSLNNFYSKYGLTNKLSVDKTGKLINI